MIFIVFLLRKWWGFVYFFLVSRDLLARRGCRGRSCVTAYLSQLVRTSKDAHRESDRTHKPFQKASGLKTLACRLSEIKADAVFYTQAPASSRGYGDK